MFTVFSNVIGININKKTAEIVICERNILYVGGSGPSNYSTIMDAIIDASEGDTIFVYEGTYNELIIINKTIILIGEDKSSTIINGSEIGVVVTINADYVNISSFTIKKSNIDKYAVEINSDYCNISNNIFLDNGYGLYIIGSENNIISMNTFSNHRRDCIYIENSNNNIISNNNFPDKPPGTVITILYSYSIIISNNSFTQTGTVISSGWCDILYISNNIFIGESGRGVDLYYTDNSTIKNNIISYYEMSISLGYCNNNIIKNNTMTDCTYMSILFDLKNDFNTISNNYISKNEWGIFMMNFCNKNNISYNYFTSNNYGIYIQYQTSCDNNSMNHNNFYNNVNAIDGGSNTIWNESYPSGGNFWDDYLGNDSNGDGIGDTALNISGGGGNKDYYPLMNPWGEQRPVANYTYFEEFGGYVFDASLSYDRDGDVISFEWDFGDGIIDSGMVVSHAYNDSGEYDVILTITDDEGYKGNLTKTINAVKNYPPENPTIDGPSSGGWGKPYHFTFQTSDNEGSDVWYFVEWGDGKDTGWMGPYTSGDEITDSHTWTEQETFTIRCKAKDMYNVHSEWGEFEITIPRTRASSFHWLFERFPLLVRLLDLLK
jgi:parallel beta-helix repeat protein